MSETSLLQDVRDSMRIKHHAIDGVISRDIETAYLDLQKVGVYPYMKDEAGNEKEVDGIKAAKDRLIAKAVELYCKAEANYQGKGEQYRKSYESLKDSLALSGDYK